MTRRVFDGEIAHEIAGDDEERYERMRAVARSLLDVVRDGLLRDGEVRLHGFGTFRLQHTAARTGRNPRTGEPVEIPARNRVLFRPAKALRERIEPHRAATVLTEPQPSREATLGGRAPVRTVADVWASPRSASAEPGAAEGDGARPSREASLGGEAPKVSQAVATVPAVPPRADRQPIYTHAVSTAPGVGSGASREATLGSGASRETGAGVLPGDEKEDWVVEGEADMPRHRMARVAADDGPLNESGPGGGASGAQSAGRGPERQEGERERRRGGFWAALVLVLLLLGVAIWLLWPTSEPGPRVADQDGVPPAEQGAGADQASGQDGSADAAGATSSEPTTAGGGSAPSGSPTQDSAAADTNGTSQAGATGETTETAEAGESGDTTEPATGADAATAAGEGNGETAEPASGEGGQASARAEGDGAEAASDEAGGETASDEAGGETALASGTEESSSSAAASATEGGGDPPASAGQGVTAGSQSSEAGGSGVEAPGEEQPLHGMAAAGSTRTPPTDSGSQRASAPDAGNGSMPTSAQDIEDAGAKPATDAGAGEGSATGDAFFEGREYTVQPGDTLWGLAERNYVNPFFWPHIWNNNDDLANPDRISVDQLLWLPTLEGEPTNLTAADRRSIAQGYLQLYRFFKETGDANPGYALVGVRFFDPSVLPERLRGSAAVKPSTALAATFKARLESRFATR